MIVEQHEEASTCHRGDTAVEERAGAHRPVLHSCHQFCVATHKAGRKRWVMKPGLKGNGQADAVEADIDDLRADLFH